MSDAPRSEPDPTGPDADHTGADASHTGPDASHTGPDASHTGPDASHTGPDAGHTGHRLRRARLTLHQVRQGTGRAIGTVGHTFSTAGHAVGRARHAIGPAGHALRPAAHALGRTGHALSHLGHAVIHAHWRRIGRGAGYGVAVVAVSLVGIVLGLLVGGTTPQDVGPFQASFSVQPSWSGDTDVSMPPLGSLIVNSHDGPAHLSVRLGSLDQRRTEQLVADPSGIANASASAIDDVQRGITRLVVQSTGAALLGALVLAALIFRRMKTTAWAGVTALCVLGGTAVWTGSTLHPQAIEEPRYEGLLVNAPTVVGNARRIASRYDEYSAELQRLVRNVSELYTTVSTLPVYEPSDGTTKVLHVSDLHLNPSSWDVIRDRRTAVRHRHRGGHRRHRRLGLQPGGPVRRQRRTAGRPVRLRPGQPRLAGDRGGGAGRGRRGTRRRGPTVRGLTFAGIGDPRFTPDKESSPANSKDAQLAGRGLTATGEALARRIRANKLPVDIGLVHDPAAALPLDGSCPLVLAGHTHSRQVRTLPNGTFLQVEGSTGGAGLRGLEKDDGPLPLEMSVLYFGPDKLLQAYDTSPSAVPAVPR